jgi:hypothetical protein
MTVTSSAVLQEERELVRSCEMARSHLVDERVVSEGQYANVDPWINGSRTDRCHQLKQNFRMEFDNLHDAAPEVNII